MKNTFETRLAAIEWIAQKAQDEGQFEVWREQLNYNFIYTGQYYIDTSVPTAEVNFLEKEKR